MARFDFQKQASVAAMLLALFAAGCLALSIESEPVKVTHRNSGPRYDITANEENEVERTKMTPEEPQVTRPQAPPSSQAEDGEQATPIGHVAIRRIFLFPMMSARGPGESEQAGGEQASRDGEGEREQEMPSMFAKPFWPFLSPARSHGRVEPTGDAPHRPHLFGQDEASRAPGSSASSERDQDRAASGERGATRDAPDRPLLDPIQMMLEMMHQALGAQLAAGDLSKQQEDMRPAPGGNDNSQAASSSSSEERPSLPGQWLIGPKAPKQATNETREDIVEIEGKKYLRKVVVNRHVGENIVFMTRRLIFVPLNETSAESPATTETVPTTTTTTTLSDSTATTTTGSPATTEEPSAIPNRVGENKPTTTTSAPGESSPTVVSVTTKGPESPSTEAATPAPSTEQPATAEATTQSKPSESFVERVSEVLEKATERLIEEPKSPASGPTTTGRPSTASDKPAQ